MSHLRGSILQPLGVRFYVVFGLLTGIMLATGIIQPHLSVSVLFVAGLSLFVTWLLLGGVWLVSGMANLGRHWSQRKSWWRWMIAPPIVLLFVSGRPALNLKFWMARPTLERLAAVVAATPSGAPRLPDQTVWFMRMRDIQPITGGGMRFATSTGGNPFDYTGLAYHPTPVSEGTEVDGCYFSPYCGRWSTFWRP